MLFASAVYSAEVQIVVSGKYQGTVTAYQVGSVTYVDSQEIGAAYGGQVFWFPVAGRVQISLRGKQIRFLVDSPKVQLESQTVAMSRPVIARTSHAFIPLEFFLTKEFADFADIDSQFNVDTELLSIDRRTTVGPVRWFSYPDFTRVEVPLGRNTGYTASRRGRSGMDLTFPFGQIGESQVLILDDGAVKEVKLTQEPKVVRLSVRLGSKAVSWDSLEEENPKRLEINIYHTKEAARAGARKLMQSQQPGASSPVVIGQAPARIAVATAPASESAVEPDVDEATAPFAVKAATAAPPVPVAAAAPPAPAPKPAPVAVPPAPPPPVNKPRRIRIVVDAGHGGKDSGAKGRHHVLEKDLNLKAAKELASLLDQEGMFEILLIRDDDTFVPLDERSRRANEFQADLFVSLHCNAASRRSENGFEIYFLSEHASDPESQRVAEMENASLQLEGRTAEEEEAAGVLHAMAKTEYINDSSQVAGLMSQELSRRERLFDRGAKQAAFYVLRGTYSPAVLVEMGFVTNNKDAANLQSKKFRKRLIDGIYAGILDFGKVKGWDLRTPR